MAVDDRDLDGGLAAQCRQRHLARARRDGAGQRLPLSPAMARISAAPLAAARGLPDLAASAPSSASIAASAGDIDPASRRMQIEMAGGELGELGEAAGDGQPRDRMTAQIFQCAADEIAHVDQGVLGQTVKALHGALRGRAGRRGDVVEAGGARDIDPAVDRVDPGGAGIGNDDRRSCRGSRARRRCRAARSSSSRRGARRRGSRS